LIMGFDDLGHLLSGEAFTIDYIDGFQPIHTHFLTP